MALFGVTFNASLGARLRDAPAHLQNALPHEVDSVITALRASQTSDAAQGYLRHAINDATHQLYLGLLLVALLTAYAVWMIPRSFDVATHDIGS